MTDLGNKGIAEALADLASPREPAAAGVASAVSAATAAGVVELTATLAARRIAEQDRGNGEGAADRMRELAQQAEKLRGRLLVAADEDARAYARVIKPARATSSQGPWIRPATRRLRSPRAPQQSPSEPPRWPTPGIGRSRPTRSSPGSWPRQQQGDPPGWWRRISPESPGTPAPHAPAPRPTWPTGRAVTRPTGPGMRGPRRWIPRGAERPAHWLRSRVCPGRRWWT